MKQRYNPDFPKMMRLCETNFAQLRRLLPRNDEAGASVIYQVSGARYQLTIQESMRYTTLRQVAPAVSYWSLPSMSVRLYHDALVAKCVQRNRSIVSKRAMIILIKTASGVMKNTR